MAFEAEGDSPALARHYYARAVNAAPLEESAWGLWAEFEEQMGATARAETLYKHSQIVHTQALLEESIGGGAKGKKKNPLAPSDLYR